jgi:MFS family permease
MASFLNQIFFSETNSISSQLLLALAFCSTFIFRPFGALIFGYIGDNIGRKSVIVVTMMIMAFTSVTMANLPTYAQIGVAASFIVTICRILQGISSAGEKIGADLYLTEITTPPSRYFFVSLSGVFAALGTSSAIFAVYLINWYQFNFRLLFWIGGITALLALLIRVKTKESPIFLHATNLTTSEENKSSYKAIWAYFAIDSVWPIIFYLVYIYFSILLKDNFDYSLKEVTLHNLTLSLIELVSLICMSIMTYKIFPLKILRIKLFFFSLFVLFCPYIIPLLNSPFKIMCLQIYILIFAPTSFPAAAIFFMHFPIKKRFTYTSLMNAFSRALVYPLTAFGLIYIINIWGYFGLSAILLVACLSFGLGLNYFEKASLK